MRQQKTTWKSVGIPDVLFKRIEDLIAELGTPSVAEYVRVAILMREKFDREMLLTEEKE